MATLPPVKAVTRDHYSREMRFEFCDRRSRTGGVYDLPPTEQEALLLPGHLPDWGDFLPDFAIVLGLGEPTDDSGVRWNDLRVHVGGLQWSALLDGYAPTSGAREPLASCEWHTVDVLLNGSYGKSPAPAWLVDLVRERTPWGDLLDQAAACRNLAGSAPSVRARTGGDTA